MKNYVTQTFTQRPTEFSA